MNVGTMNKIFPQGESESNATAGRKAHPGKKGCGPFCCSRREAWLSAFVLLLLAILAALLVVAIILGRPSHIPDQALSRLPCGLATVANCPMQPPPSGNSLEKETQSCMTVSNRTGFLCHDRRYCIPAHGVCDGFPTCPHGEDEDESLCRDLPQNLPSFLLAYCGDPASWIYSDQKCDGTNHCGDCSDELSPVTTCPPCGPGWWRCTPIVFNYCSCIPRVLCRDHVQHCSDWSDEYVCPGP